MKILFQGDSITDCLRDREGNPSHHLGKGYAYICAGRIAYEQPEKDYTFINRGVGGDTCAQMYGRWQNDTLNLKPDVLSILIGVNDAGEAVRSPDLAFVYDRYESVYRLALNEVKELLPETRLILMEPFLLDAGNFDHDFITTRKKILVGKQETVRKLADEFNAVFVPLQEKFNQAAKKREDSFWLFDSVHPTHAGHTLIADSWLDATKEIFGG